MKSKLKWVSGVLGAVLALSLVFGAGVYASQWLNFTGKEQIERSESDVDKIMDILREVNNEKISIEEAYAELEAMNPKGLVDKIKTLEKDLGDKDKIIANHVIVTEQLKQDKAQLTTEVANQKQQVVNKQNEVDNKQKEIEQKQQEIQQKIEEGNRKVAEKQAELDGVAGQRDEHKRVAEELQQQINQNNNYVQHLEKELEKANNAAQSVSNKTSEALEEAENYK